MAYWEAWLALVSWLGTFAKLYTQWIPVPMPELSSHREADCQSALGLMLLMDWMQLMVHLEFVR
ncbi:MAG: hypothetical protein AAGH78_03290 [Cyanobacteria bacterium P01_H01_bin.58]